MKSICIIAIAVFSGLLVAYGQPLFKESIEQQIIAKEREELDALKRGDINAFANLIADEAVFVNAQGPGSKAEVVRHVADFKLLEYSMEDVRFVPLSEKSGRDQKSEVRGQRSETGDRRSEVEKLKAALTSDL